MMDKYHMAPSGLVHRNPPSPADTPVAVIPYEDREQVERLATEYVRTWLGPREGVSPETVEQMQAALREFADPKPPRPEEPTGLGAVVEDADGGCWIRVARKSGNVWQRPIGTYRRWAELDVVRILSPGYDPEATP